VAFFHTTLSACSKGWLPARGKKHLSLAGNDLSTIPDQLLADGFTHLEHSLNLSRCRLSSDQVSRLLESNLTISCLNLASICLAQVLHVVN
jgi:hypothetical protein